VEVCADLHLLGEQFIEILPKERVGDSFEPIRLEFRPKMVENRVRSGYVLARSTERRDRGSVGASADEDLIDILSSDFSVITKERETSSSTGLTRKLRSWSS